MCVLSFHGHTPLVCSFREGARPLRSPGSAPVTHNERRSIYWAPT